MRVILITFFLVLNFSCSKKISEADVKVEEKKAAITPKKFPYDLPKIGFGRTVALNYRFASSYENMTFSPSARFPVPGDRPFFVNMYEVDEIKVLYYDNQDILKVSYIDESKVTDPYAPTQELLNHPSLTNIADPYRHFTFRKYETEFPEQDMARKYFIVESEAAELPYVSNFKVMFWLECEGGLNWKNSTNYKCPSHRFKFHYRLLDYKMSQVDM